MASHHVDESRVRGGDWVVVSDLDYYRQRELFYRWEAVAVSTHVVWHSGINDPLMSRCGWESTSGESEGIAVSGRSKSCCRSGFLHFPPLIHTFKEDAIDFDVSCQPPLEANAVIIVSSLLSAFPLSSCICSMAVNFAIGAHNFVTVSGSTTSTVSTMSTASIPSSVSTTPMAVASAMVPATFSEQGSPLGCISKFFGKAGCSFFF